METTLFYLLKSGFSMSVFILIYRILFKNEKRLILNRIFLLSSIVISLILPMVNFIDLVYLYQSVDNQNTFQIIQLPVFEVSNKTESGFQWLNICFYIYSAGVCLLLLKFIIGIVTLLKIKVRSQNSKSEKMNNLPPFSFFSFIFLPNTLDGESKATVLLHEKVHVKQLHSLDIVLVEIMIILHWFIPFVWLYRATIREVHEYLADEGVLRQGIQRIKYQELLLQASSGVSGYSAVSNFNSIIKKRIVMITKEKKTNGWLKYGMVIPVILGLTLLPSLKLKSESLQKSVLVTGSVISNSSAPADTVKRVKAQSRKEVYSVVEKQPQYPGGTNEMIKFLSENVKYPEDARAKNIQGTVYISFVISETGEVGNVKVLRGVFKSIDEEAVRVVRLMPKWIPGKQKGKAVNVNFNLPIKFMLDDSAKKEDIKK